MAMGPHRKAVTRMFRSTGLVHVPEEAPLVELLRTLADEMDAGGGARTRADYLSALKDVRRVLNAAPGRPRASGESSSVKPAAAAAAVAEAENPEGEEGDEPLPVPNQLAAFRQKRGIA